MDQKRKTKRRGFVMTGGGAKGLYEAGSHKRLSPHRHGV